MSDAYPLPELTRALRSFGSGRAHPGADHDRYFAPLVAPLRELRARHDRALSLGDAGEPWRAADSLDARRIADAVRATLAAMAAERFPSSAPDRRALEAELLDEGDELLIALDGLDASGVRLRMAEGDERPAAWRAWTDALAVVFAAADRGWARSVPALTEVAPPEPRAWSRSARPRP